MAADHVQLQSPTRNHLTYILCLGVIPGPKKPKDFDSFLWPLVEELVELAVGVPAYDVLQGELFQLHTYPITVFGDILAISMVMRMKGHNGCCPCRMCNIKGFRTLNLRATTHYVPLDRSQHPDLSDNDIPIYDAQNLPMRTHAEILTQANKVEHAASKAEAERLSKRYGVKGIPILSCLSSLSFPMSFPYDFMHLIWENVVKNLVLLWTGDFKGLDAGSKDYKLDKRVWDVIGAATAASRSTIPSAFGAWPPNVAGDRTACMAETWTLWTLYLGPVLLHGKFKHAKYYNHFIKLVKLLNICLQFELSEEDIRTVRDGFIHWVKTYERRALQIIPRMRI
jgi:hypothetical protein